MLKPAAKPTPSELRRARNRRWRSRQRGGLVPFTAEIDSTGIGWLIRYGYLSEREASDARTLRATLGRAVSMLIKESSQ